MFFPTNTAEWAATPCGMSPLVRSFSHIMFPWNRHEKHLESFEGNNRQITNKVETYLCPMRTYHCGICLQTCLHECKFLDPTRRWCDHVLAGGVSPGFLAGTRQQWLSEDHKRALMWRIVFSMNRCRHTCTKIQCATKNQLRAQLKKNDWTIPASFCKIWHIADLYPRHEVWGLRQGKLQSLLQRRHTDCPLRRLS